MDPKEPIPDFCADLAKGIDQRKSDLSENHIRCEERLPDPARGYSKRLLLTYALLFLFGYLGAHKFYLGNGKAGVVYLALGLMGISGRLLLGDSLAGGLFFIVPLLFLSLFLLVDLLTIPRQVRKRLGMGEALRPRRILDRRGGVAHVHSAPFKFTRTSHYTYLGRAWRGRSGPIAGGRAASFLKNLQAR